MDEMTYEREYFAEGYRLIAGVDEVGRGPLAGPVVACAVILPADVRIEGVDDSKKLSKKKRAELAPIIKEKAICYSIAEVDEQMIDEINIYQATRLCMKRALEGLKEKPDLILSDGNLTLDIDIDQKSVVGGDGRVFSIGAASILAKVYRDELMARYALEFPGYGFEHNAGYGTREHIEGIAMRGLCRIHRRTFAEKFWEEREKTLQSNS